MIFPVMMHLPAPANESEFQKKIIDMNNKRQG